MQKHFAQAAWFPNWERDEDLVLGWALSQGDKVSNSRQSDRYQRAHIATKNPLQGSSIPSSTKFLNICNNKNQTFLAVLYVSIRFVDHTWEEL